ncbi:acyltransferase [Novosphingobium sp. FSW06-99]|uniref:acyltransferase family protein n=1 Tax=Novosphingobium sp. FSW06-99 TaxID=1739113 RepID=UPI0018D2555F|nr:acyltransferase [Novosphingobium sp. FSW06-99]
MNTAWSGEDGELSGRRVAWLDLARGLGVVLVVAGHAERGLVSAGIATGAGWRTFDLALYTFHMPLFMVLAGLNVPGSLRRGAGDFLRAKVSTIAWPYVLWSLVQGVLMVRLSGMTNGHADWSALAMIAWRPISPFWFLYALMVYMTVIALVGVRARVLIPLALAGMVASQFLDGDQIAHQVCYQAVFFVTGVLAADTIRGLRARTALLVLPAAIALWVIGCLVMPLSGEAPYLKPAALPAAIGGIAAMLALSRLLAQTGARALFVPLGTASMAIYVMHILGTAGARTALMHLHVPHWAGLYWIVCTMTGVVGPLLVHRLLARFGLLPLFGLGPRTRRGPVRPPPVIAMAALRG